jgi:hypothetical protein
MAKTEEYEKRPGRIFAFDLNNTEKAVEEVKIVADPNFKLTSPHGLNIWTDPKTGRSKLEFCKLLMYAASAS